MDNDTKKEVLKQVEKQLDKIKYGAITIKLGETHNSVDIGSEEIYRVYKPKKERIDVKDKFHKG